MSAFFTPEVKGVTYKVVDAAGEAGDASPSTPIAAIALMAVLYSSVGHGGASGYLAAMALWGLAPQEMRPAALVMNIVVTCWLLYRFQPYKLMPPWLTFLSVISQEHHGLMTSSRCQSPRLAGIIE